MPQLNILPVNVSQNIESKDGSSSLDTVTSKDDFAQYIDLHLTKNKKAESSGNIDSVKSEAHIAKNNASSIATKLEAKNSDNVVESRDKNDEIAPESLVQKVAASGKKGQIKSNEIDQKGLLESEQLMSFLTKADNTLINSSVDTSSPEQLSVEQKAYYEAQLLLKASNLVADLSAVAKALGNEQVGEAVALTEQTIAQDELLLSDTAKAAGKESNIVKLPVDSAIEGKNKDNTQTDISAVLAKSAEQKTVLPEQNIDSTSESSSEVKSTNTSRDKMNTAPPNSNTTLSSDKLIENNLVAKNSEDVDLTAEQKIAKQIKTDHAQVNNDQINQAVLSKETTTNKSAQVEVTNDKQVDNDQINQAVLSKEATTNKSGKAEVINDQRVHENEGINANATTQISNQKEAKVDAVKSPEKIVDVTAKQLNLPKESQYDKTSSLPDPQLTKSELTASSEAANIKKTATANHQLAPSSDDANKLQAKQDDKVQLSALVAEQSQLKQAAEKGNEVLVEDKVIVSVKKEAPVNGHFIDVIGKAIQTPQHIIDQQSAEMLNPSVATEVTQSQKTNTQLHQETISLFRKDFTEAVKDKVMLMISQKLQQFDIILDPPELGNIQVRVNLQGEQAVVNFLVQSQQTKDALEQNMHKLRELLAEQGVDVGDANVEQQSQQSANEENSTAGNNSQKEGKLDNMAEANDVVAHTLSAKMIDSSTTRVDYYA